MNLKYDQSEPRIDSIFEDGQRLALPAKGRCFFVNVKKTARCMP
jgi:hypothetical protein